MLCRVCSSVYPIVYMRHYNYKKSFNESNRLYKQFRKDSFLL